MIRNCTLLLIVLIAFSSCKKTKEQLLTRKWQQRSYDNPARDEQDREFDTFIDTFGRNTPPEVLLQTHGFTNVDSFRKAMFKIRSEYKVAEQKEIQTRSLEFLKNGVVYIRSTDIVDSAKWTLDTAIMQVTLDEKQLKGVGSSVYFEILNLSDTLLKIKSSSGSIATFVPAKK